jgi:hypothetical protein
MRSAMFCFLFIVFIRLNGQYYTGLHKDSLEVAIRQNEKSFRLDNSTVNTVYKYSKYVDRINEQTWLFFLDGEDHCSYHKLMSDYMNYDEVKQKLDSQFSKVAENTWEYTHLGKEYSVKLTEDEWYFTVLTKEKAE